MNTVSLLRDQARSSYKDLQTIMADVTAEMAHWRPPGTAHPIGSRYVHHLFALDIMIVGVLAGGAPLFAAEWAEKTGVSEPHPNLVDGRWVRAIDAGEAQPAEGDVLFAWAHSVEVDLNAARDYARAVHAAADARIASLVPEDLKNVRDLTAVGLGQPTVASSILPDPLIIWPQPII